MTCIKENGIKHCYRADKGNMLLESQGCFFWFFLFQTNSVVTSDVTSVDNINSSLRHSTDIFSFYHIIEYVSNIYIIHKHHAFAQYINQYIFFP